jgi:apolipoprotein N-acyltransferase
MPGVGMPHLRDGTVLLAGASILRGARISPAAVLLDARGRFLAHQEKAIPVPGGEMIPFTDWLPEGLRRAVLDGLAGMVPWVPDNLPGRRLPPLQTVEGVPFGSLICFDNAFDRVVARHVEDGARFLAVLSNEAWYMGGGELEQMVAMTVFRALENGTPLVRSTVDGASLAVDRRGRILDRLPAPDPSTPPVARFLDVTLDLGPGLLPPLAWLGDALLWLVLGSGVFVILHRLLSCARLIRTPIAAEANPPQQAPRGPPEGGS